MGKISIGSHVLANGTDPISFDDLAFRSDLFVPGEYLRVLGGQIVTGPGGGGGGTQWPTRPYRVSGGEVIEYDTIQDAIDAAASDDVVYIPAGNYDEVVTIEKSYPITVLATTPYRTRLAGSSSGLNVRSPCRVIGLWVSGDVVIEAGSGVPQNFTSLFDFCELNLVVINSGRPQFHYCRIETLEANSESMWTRGSYVWSVTGSGGGDVNLINSYLGVIADGADVVVNHSGGSSMEIDPEDNRYEYWGLPWRPDEGSLVVYSEGKWQPGLLPAHSASHTSGGSDSFLSTDVIEASVRRALFGSQILEFQSLNEYEPIVRAGSNLQSSSTIGVNTIIPETDLNVYPGVISGLGWSVNLRSQDAGKFTGITIGRTGHDGSIGVAAAASQWLPSSAAGDVVIRAVTSDLLLGSMATTGQVRVITGGAGGAERLRISDVGYVGVGNFTGRKPQYNLTLRYDATAAVELPAPAGVTATATTGGYLSAGTYYIRVVASGVGGTSLGSAQVSATVDGSTTNAIQVSWNYLPGAINFRVYVGTTSGGQDRYWTVTGLSYTITRYGSGDGSTSGTVPTECTARMVTISPSVQRLYGEVYVGDPCPGRTSAKTVVHIVGPNAPSGTSSALDIQWEFSAAGNAAIRAYRGGSYDTYLQFLTSPSGSSTPVVRATITSAGDFVLASGALYAGGGVAISSGRTFYASDGLESSPSYSFNNAMSTGMYRAAGNNLSFAVGGVPRLALTGSNAALLGGVPALTGTGVHIFGNTLRVDTSRTPSSSGAEGLPGEICWDTDYIYVCVGVSTWKRVAITTW